MPQLPLCAGLTVDDRVRRTRLDCLHTRLLNVSLATWHFFILLAEQRLVCLSYAVAVCDDNATRKQRLPVQARQIWLNLHGPGDSRRKCRPHKTDVFHFDAFARSRAPPMDIFHSRRFLEIFAAHKSKADTSRKPAGPSLDKATIICLTLSSFTLVLDLLQLKSDNDSQRQYGTVDMDPRTSPPPRSDQSGIVGFCFILTFASNLNLHELGCMSFDAWRPSVHTSRVTIVFSFPPRV